MTHSGSPFHFAGSLYSFLINFTYYSLHLSTFLIHRERWTRTRTSVGSDHQQLLRCDNYEGKHEETSPSHTFSFSASHSQANQTEIQLTPAILQKVLSIGSSPRTVSIVSCFLAPGKLIITGQGSNLFVLGSDSKKESQQDIH